MSAKKRRRLEKTWAKSFREKCLPLINEDLFRPLYCEDNGAPNKSVRVLVGAMILQALFDLTDEEAQAAIDYDLRWHMALGLDPCEDQDYLFQRTMQYFRVKLLTHEMVQIVFKELTDKLIRVLGIKIGLQRLDTTHLLSNFARLSRLGMFCETIRVLLKTLQRESPALLTEIAASLRLRYLRDDGTDSSYDDARSSDSRRRLSVTARDAYRLQEALHGVTLSKDSTEAYAILQRLVAEHCEIVTTPHEALEGDADADLPAVPVVVKDAKKLTGSVLQTPHDPGVTYSGHKGQGYEALISETCDPANPVQLITHASLERSCESDADRLLPAVDALVERNIQPETLLADTSFGSVENLVDCARRGVELISPQPGGSIDKKVTTPHLCVNDEEFTVQLVSNQPPSICPCGIEAIQTVLHNDPIDGPVAVLQMPTTSCETCIRHKWCPVLTMENGTTLVLIALHENLPSHRRASEQEEAFRSRYRPRAGIEGTNSEVKRGQGLGNIRVRGAERVEFALFVSLLACNMKRAMKYFQTQAQMARLVGHVTIILVKKATLVAIQSFCEAIMAIAQLDFVNHVSLVVSI
jgi:hypothetical protein